MLGRVPDGDVARGLGLAVHAQGGERLVLRVLLPNAVEHVVRAHVHERDVMVLRDPGEQSRALRVRLPRDRTAPAVSALSTAV